MPRRSQSIDLGIRGIRGDVGDHIAYFWETEEEFDDATGFLDTGLELGDHIVVFGHDEANLRVLERLNGRGHSWKRLESQGRLSVLGPEASGEMMLSRIGAAFQKAINAGSTMIRLLGNIGWGKQDWPDEHDILRFEAKVTNAAASFPCIVVCMYDIKSLPGSVVLHGAFGTHPLTIHGNLIRENPMCEHVDAYLARLEARNLASAVER